MQNIILIFIHLGAAAIALGTLIFGIIVLRPAIKKKHDGGTPNENSVELTLMDFLAPTVLACVFVLIVTGVYYLLVNYTDQVNLKEGYYNIFGMKMIFVVATLGLTIYQTFVLRSRISDLDLRPENKKIIPATLSGMLNVGYISLWTLVTAIFFGVYLARYSS
jgi:putative copper export protein